MEWIQWVALVLAVVPAVLIMRHFVKNDVFPEPARLVWGAFALGVVVTVPAALLEGWWGSLPAWRGLLSVPVLAVLADAVFRVALVEEGCKFLVLYGFCMRRRQFDEPMDGVVYGVAVAMGFACFENLIYVWDGGLVVALIRAVTAIPGHGLFGAVMGYYAGRTLVEPRRRFALLARGLAYAVLLHAAYDAPLFYMALSGAGGHWFMPGWIPILLLDQGWKRIADRIAEVRGEQHMLADGASCKWPVREEVAAAESAAEPIAESAAESAVGKQARSPKDTTAYASGILALFSLLWLIFVVAGVVVFATASIVAVLVALVGLWKMDLRLVFQCVVYVFLPFCFFLWSMRDMQRRA